MKTNKEKEKEYYNLTKIRNISVSVVILILLSSILLSSLVIVVSAQPEVTRSITQSVVEPGWEVLIKINFTASEDMTGVVLSDKVENARWDITNMSAEGSSPRINPDTGAVEFLWYLIKSGTEVMATYTLHVPDVASIEPYVLSGSLTSQDPEFDKDITGDYLLLVKDDAEPPVIHSVILDNNNVTVGDQIFVTVNVTDNLGVANVTAKGVALSQSEGDNWTGNIIAEEEGTDIVVNVTAKDTANQKPNVATDESQKYNAFAVGASPTPTSTPSNGGSNGGGGGGGGGGFPTPTPSPTTSPNTTSTPTISPTITPTVSPIKASTSTQSAPTVTPIPTPKEGLLPGFSALFAVTGLVAVAYLILRRGD